MTESLDARLCQDCGCEVGEENRGPAYNVGLGPQYWCSVCRPPATTVGEVIGDLVWWMEITRDC